MKKSEPGPRTLLRFENLKLKFFGLLILAAIPWLAQGLVASFATQQMMAQTDLWTPGTWNDAQVLRIFQEAKPTVSLESKLETNQQGFHPERHDHLTVIAPTKAEAIAGRQTIVEVMRAGFTRENAGFLNSSREGPYAKPVPNATSEGLRNDCRWLAFTLLLWAFVNLFLEWRRSHLPILALAGVLATFLTFAAIFTGSFGLILLFGLPVAFVILVSYLTLRVRKAARWWEGRARITRSGVEVSHSHFKTTEVINKPGVAYEFTAGSDTIQGERIGLGLGQPERVDQTLKKYPVGAEVPVFYDPENPKDCTLEREPPVSLGCLWGGTITALLVYLGITAWVWSGWSLVTYLANRFPEQHHVVGVLATGTLGLFCLASGIWNRLNPRQLAPWIATKGTIVSSDVESYTEHDSSSSRSVRYSAVIEFSYTVDGQEYHGTKGATDLVKVTVGSGKASADAETARYPVGMAVDVYYDPENPSKASLDPHPGTTINGTSSLAVGATLVAVAIYLARH